MKWWKVESLIKSAKKLESKSFTILNVYLNRHISEMFRGSASNFLPRWHPTITDQSNVASSSAGGVSTICSSPWPPSHGRSSPNVQTAFHTVRPSSDERFSQAILHWNDIFFIFVNRKSQFMVISTDFEKQQQYFDKKILLYQYIAILLYLFIVILLVSDECLRVVFFDARV
jgi:hypothetical protein